jgi:mono/diheme cytochrome c family protein
MHRLLRGRARSLAVLLAVAAGISAACAPAGGGARVPDAARGRTAYVTWCVACHGPDPSVDGPIGPAIRGSSAELLRARVIDASYPPGYVPKRDTRLMIPVPQAAPSLADLEAYLR